MEEHGVLLKDSIGHALSVFMAFFAIMNPIANTPIFLGLTANDPPEIKKRVAMQALVAHPLVPSWEVAKPLLEELLAANRPWLPWVV